MKNADGMLKQIMDEVDTNKDGKIQYDGMLFRLFFGSTTTSHPPDHVTIRYRDKMLTRLITQSSVNSSRKLSDNCERFFGQSIRMAMESSPRTSSR